MKYTSTFVTISLALAVTCATIPCFFVFAAVAGGSATTNVAAGFPGKEWAISTPEDEGSHLARLARLVESVGAYHYDSLTVVRHGRIVADPYYAPYLPGISHDLRSLPKASLAR